LLNTSNLAGQIDYLADTIANKFERKIQKPQQAIQIEYIDSDEDLKSLDELEDLIIDNSDLNEEAKHAVSHI
jgi:hypothetical protein